MKKNSKKCGCDCGCSQAALEKPADALMAVAVMAVSADGKLDKREIADLEKVLAANPLFSHVRDQREYMGCVSAIIAGRKRDEVLKEAADLLSPSLRETAYAWAVHMIAADGRFVSPEHRFLSVLRKTLGIHGVLAGKINSIVPMLSRRK